MVFDALSSLFGDRIMMVRLLTFALKHVLRLAGRIAKALGRRLPGPLPTFVQPGRSVPPRQPDQILVAHLKMDGRRKRAWGMPSSHRHVFGCFTDKAVMILLTEHY